MNQVRFVQGWLSIVMWVLLSGCAGDAPPSNDAANGLQESIGTQLIRVVAPLRDQRFSTLLDFEANTDSVFIVSKPPGHLIYDRSHTGRRSLRIEPDTQRVAIKLSSLLSGRPFPGDWTLIGGFLYSEDPIEVTVNVEGAGFVVPARNVTLAANTWTMALVDISSAVTRTPPSSAPAASSAMLVFTLPNHSGSVWCDDILLIDNAQTLVSNDPSTAKPSPTTGAPTTAPWSVERRGLNYIGAVPGRFNFQLVSSEASQSGWTVEEANEFRARFKSDGSTKHLTVYADGRAYWDGEYRAMSAAARANPLFAEEHLSPADLAIPEELGRLNRGTPGDANNDGYNELRGAYQLIANGARLEAKITPRTAALAGPVLEITGLPPGNVLVTAEGRLVEKTTRLSDGALLVELPGKIDRPITVNLRSQ